jgi:small subunit ribosomal protein S16
LAVKIRLKRMGSKKKPFYRVIATDSRNARDGRFIETLGYYNPLQDPPQIKIEEENLFKWLDRGAVPTDNAESILRRIGVMQKWQLLKQGVKKEDLEAKMAEMGIKTAPEATAGKKKKATAEEAPAVETPTEEAGTGEAAGAETPKEAAPPEEASKEALKEEAEAEAPAAPATAEEAPTAEAEANEEESKKGD